ncbi:reverse transcriptase domain-containing protein [Pedobacter kyungheensis]|uniref:reverse transcriptase domain-containing protein n=1 Tax=Pedobacter kyungheensis TaxID=1069985 RepID=UPI00068D8A90|nr:reverse transcriptase domain-containing protein [Pedobacter kyungheensis]
MQDFTFNPKDDSWLKNRGYLHITKKWNVKNKRAEIYSKLQDRNFIAKHAFFPLLHAVIKERKYKKHPETKERSHVHKSGTDRKVEHKPTAKKRPLHYATHIDALIFSFYSAWLIELYEKKLQSDEELHNAIIAYRKIPQSIENPKGKSTIHFAKEAFDEIKLRANDGCIVLMFDIESFFSSLNHKKLKAAWVDLLHAPTSSGNVQRTLPPDHYNVFKACTHFNYILKDQLRLKQCKIGRREGFDETKLAAIRKNHGVEAFFSDPAEFRDELKNKKLQVFSKQFMKNGQQIGIPQGLPISAVLANLYLLEFDCSIIDDLVKDKQCFYRRYSDDILIICKPDQKDEIERIVIEKIDKADLVISKHKTETFYFNKNDILKGKRLTYLGFEFDGENAFVKSANLARFYRRMIHAVKIKAERAVKLAFADNTKPFIFKSRLVKLYKRVDLDSEREKPFKIKRLVKGRNGLYVYKEKTVDPKDLKEYKPKKSNYITYMKKATDTIGSGKIFNQIKNRKAIFHKAMSHHLKRLKAKYAELYS